MKPRSLLIGHSEYVVKWTKRAVDALANDKISGGAVSLRRRTIAVEPLPESPNAEREVLLHEVLHACFMATAVPLTEKQEELMVAVLAPELLQTLRRNPRLIQYLLAE